MKLQRPPAPSHGSYVGRGAEVLAWILCDRLGHRQQALHDLGVRTMHHYHDLHSHGHGCAMQDALKNQKPELLWVHLAGPAAGSGNKRDNARTELMAKLIHQQLNEERYCVLDECMPPRMCIATTKKEILWHSGVGFESGVGWPFWQACCEIALSNAVPPNPRCAHRALCVKAVSAA